MERHSHNDGIVEQDQTDLGVACVGAPVFEDREVLAAISVSIPTARLAEEVKHSLIAKVCSAAKKITAQLDKKSSSKNH